jgi:Flp pilus assembly protein TadD
VVAEPDSSAARFGLGVALARLGFWKESTRAFEKAVSLDGENVRAWSNLSASYETMGRLGEAEHAARRAIAVSGGTHFRAFFNLATVQLRTGETAEACKSLDRALQINPYYVRAAAEATRSCGRPPRVSENGPR